MDDKLLKEATEIGDLLRSLREEKEMSIVDAAAEMPITAGTIGAIENGEIETPSLEALEAFASLYDVSLERLTDALPGDAEPNEQIANSQKQPAIGRLFVEAATGKDIDIKLIAPGWGSSGYWSKEVLETQGPATWPKGTHMYINHQSLSEQLDRPERDLHNLAAVTITTPTWQDSHKEGPGLYATARVFSDFVPLVEEKGEYIGLSIVAGGDSEMGEAEGQQGPIITTLAHGFSVDFVTKPGAGGQIVFESANDDWLFSEAVTLITEEKQPYTAPDFTEAEADLKLSDIIDALRKENHDLRNQLLKVEIDRLITEALAPYNFPPAIADLITVGAKTAVIITEAGKVDGAQLLTEVNKLSEQVSNSLPRGKAVVTGNGQSQPESPDTLTLSEANKIAIDLLIMDGYSEKAAKETILGG